MKIFKNIFILSALAALVLSACTPEAQPTKSSIQFTVRTSEVAHNYVKLSITHNGPEDITWYGELVEDASKSDYEAFTKIYTSLLTSGKLKELKRSKERLILLDNLEENKKYKYIVFGVKEDGKLYENANMATISFTTSTNIYLLTETEDWTFTHTRNEAGDKEIIDVKAKKGGRFGWNYVSLASLDAWTEENPDGYELWDEGIYMTTVDAIEMFVLQEISNIHLNIANGAEIEDLTYTQGDPFELPRIQSGKYALVAYGFDGSGQHTQTYSIDTLEINEENAKAEFEKWFGTYSLKGMCDVNKEDGTVVEEEREYEVTIEPVDNNFMYRIRGWECGESVQYDWEEDIMQLDKEKGEYLGFPAYYNKGNLEIRESPITYITFDGVNPLILGMYGYAYNATEKAEIPVIFDGTPMASALPIADGQTTTELTPLSSSYGSVSWTYSKMGYLAWSEYTGAYQTVNPAMKLPITVTKISDDYPQSTLKIESGKGSAGAVSFSKDTKKELNLRMPDGELKRIEIR